ncbi:MAG: hypothetical protein LKI18_03830 [Prevotella sp.]|jgi:hypothetical protein|nr:hypothetical protein [Prevotella sp.]
MLSATEGKKLMGKIRIIKMLQVRLDQQNAELDKQDEESRSREESLNARIDELSRLTRVNTETRLS